MNKVHLIDCMEYMKDCKDNQFDLSLTDPPYNVGLKYNTHNDNMTNYEEWCDLWFAELQRISRRQVMTIGMLNLKYWINKNPLWVFSWVKPNQNSPSRLGGFNAWEPVVIFGKDKKRVGQDILISPIGIQQDASFHPCPKHLKSWKKILTIFADKEYSIFDPFSGAGTTRIACQDLGFDFEGCELDTDYHAAQEKRYQNYIKQSELFGKEEIQDLVYNK